MKWYRQLPFAVYSLLLSMAVGLVLWLTKITGEAFALLSAIGLELVIVVHRVLFQIEKAEDPLRSLFRTAKIDEALEAGRHIIRSGNPQARALLEGTANAFSERVKALHSGTVRCSPSEFMEFAEGLFESAKPGHRLCATSHLAGGAYWDRLYGQRYENLNRAAAARGLEIERIYLLRDDDHLEEVRATLERQAAFSTVRTVLLNEIDDSVAAPRRDFFVYHTEVVAEFVFAEPNMTLEYINLTTDDGQVRNLAREYARIRDSFSHRYAARTVASPS
jgi:hypothetical protein